jgi:ABC-type dipeptide/oligopeptide/nickel transport system permease subunit
MIEVKEDKVKTPFYYTQKRFLANKPAVVGLVVIIISVIISILGYSIMPDNTPYADERAEQIAKKPPGFTVKILKIRKNRAVKTKDFISRTLFGQERLHDILPIESYRVNKRDMTVFAKVYGQGGSETAYPLADLVLPLYIGKTDKIRADEAGNFMFKGESIVYVDLQENVQTISLNQLLQQFEKECIETRTYWLGTDKGGRDMLSRLLFGVRISLGIGLIAVFISFLVGVTLGAMAGFFGGTMDAFIMWFMTVVWSIPGIMLVIAISLALGKGILVAFIAIGLTTWVEIARVVRGQIMGVKEKLFIEAARAMGMRNRRIIVVHILPNIMGPLIVILTSNFASAILTEAGLSFLGLSAQPPMASWGVMVNEGRDLMTTPEGTYLVLLPSLCIAIMVLAFNLFGNGLRDAYDPKTLGK